MLLNALIISIIVLVVIAMISMHKDYELKRYNNGYSRLTGRKWNRFPYNEFKFGPIHARRYIAGDDEMIIIFAEVEK